jgi:hypothetical protein
VVVLHDEIGALDQQHAHLAGQERVPEVGRVVDPGGQGHRHRALAGARSHETQGLQQERRIVVDRPYRIGREQLGEYPAEQVAVLQHVGDAAWHAAVVLEDEVLAPVVADDIRADHVGEDLPWRNDPQ